MPSPGPLPRPPLDFVLRLDLTLLPLGLTLVSSYASSPPACDLALVAFLSLIFYVSQMLVVVMRSMYFALAFTSGAPLPPPLLSNRLALSSLLFYVFLSLF